MTAQTSRTLADLLSKAAQRIREQAERNKYDGGSLTVAPPDLLFAAALEAGRDALLSVRSTADQGWQPIETAPKDGTWLLFHIKQTRNGHHRAYRIGHWAERPSFRNEASWVMDNGFGEPTHWMPLPQAPPEDQP